MVPITKQNEMYQIQKLLKGVLLCKLKSPVAKGNYKAPVPNKLPNYTSVRGKRTMTNESNEMNAHEKKRRQQVEELRENLSAKVGLVFVALDHLHTDVQNERYVGLQENDVQTIEELMRDANLLLAILHPDEMNEW
jgi:hypothetical protein